MMKTKRNAFMRIFRWIFFKQVKVESDRPDMHIDSFLSQPIDGNSDTEEIINWGVTGSVGAGIAVAVILGIIFL